MNTIRLHKITTTYVDPYKRDYWSTMPASNEVHPETGLEYEEWTDAESAEFVLPKSIKIDDESGMLYDTRTNRLLRIDMNAGGEPRILLEDGYHVLKRA